MSTARRRLTWLVLAAAAVGLVAAVSIAAMTGAPAPADPGDTAAEPGATADRPASESASSPTETAWSPTEIASSPAAGRPRGPADALPTGEPSRYELVDPAFRPLTSEGGDPLSEVLFGEHDGAGYRIEVPLDWNGDLVMYAHGFRGDTALLTVDDPPFGLREHLVDSGYAWAASSYRANGYDVAAGVRDTAALARRFSELVGSPGRTYLVGVSMGGHVVGRMIEEQPRAYDGALPLCGVLGDVELFDWYLDYNLAAQALAGVDAYPAGADYRDEALPRMAVRLGLPPRARTAAGEIFEDVAVRLSGGERPGDRAAFEYWSGGGRGYFVFDIYTNDAGMGLAPGRPAQNVGTDYGEASVNERVERVGAEPGTRDGLPGIPVLTGDIRVPVLSLHTLGDLFVPISMEQIYAREAAASGAGDLFIARAVRALEHCEFTATEVVEAFDDLVGWIEGRASGETSPPAGDPLLDAEAVADPAFGCAFTRGATTGTREVFPACPRLTNG